MFLIVSCFLSNVSLLFYAVIQTLCNLIRLGSLVLAHEVSTKGNPTVCLFVGLDLEINAALPHHRHRLARACMHHRRVLALADLRHVNGNRCGNSRSALAPNISIKTATVALILLEISKARTCAPTRASAHDSAALLGSAV